MSYGGVGGRSSERQVGGALPQTQPLRPPPPAPPSPAGGRQTAHHGGWRLDPLLSCLLTAAGQECCWSGMEVGPSPLREV